MSTTSKEIAVPDKNAALALADLANDFAGAVDVRQELIKTPRIKLAQKMSGATDGGMAKPGDFTCDAKGINFGRELTIIPITISESASLLYDREKPPAVMPPGLVPKKAAILCSSGDLVHSRNGDKCTACPFGEFHSDWSKDRAPKCRLAIDVVCLISGNTDPMILSFRKTSYAAGKQLVNQVVNDPRKVPFGHAYTLKAEHKSQDDNKWEIISPVIAKEPLDDESLRAIIPVAKQVLAAKLKGQIVQEEEADDIPI